MAAPEFGIAAEPTGFALSSDVAEVATRMIQTHATLHDLRSVRLAYMVNHAKPPKTDKGIHALAKAVLAPALWQVLSEYDGAVWVNATIWQSLSPRQREAIVLHELLHFMVDDETGVLQTVPHDVEEFSRVVAEYGPWHGALDHFGEQMRLWSGTPDNAPGRLVSLDGGRDAIGDD
jgi:hypothetical protein